MSIADKLTKILSIKKGIQEALIAQGVNISESTPFSEYVSKVEEVVNPSPEDWTPNPEWYDIETILKEDTREYSGKFIALIEDSEDTTTFSLGETNVTAVYTSDGSFYSYADNGSSVTHTWDKAQDKECGEIHKVRYIMYYLASDTLSTATIAAPPRVTLYILYDCDLSVAHACSGGYGSLKAFDFINGHGYKNVTSFKNFCNGGYSLEHIPGNIDTSQSTDFTAFLGQAFKLKKLPNIDTSKGLTFENFCRNCYTLSNFPESLDMSSATSLLNAFRSCSGMVKSPKLLNTGNCTDFGNFMAYCSVLLEAPELDTSKGAYMDGMFTGCYYMRKCGALDISNVTNTYGLVNMFAQCYSLTTLPFTSIGSNIKNLGGLFHACYALKELPSEINTPNCTTFANCFYMCYSAEKLPTVMNTSAGKDFSKFLYDCRIVGDGSSEGLYLDLSKATTITDAFYNLQQVENLFIKLPALSVSLSNCSRLTKAALQYLADNAADASALATKPTLTLGSTLIARAGGTSGTIISTLTSKGWTVN